MFRRMMSYLTQPSEIRRFNSSDPSWRKLVLYSHSQRDWLVYEPILLELVHQFKQILSFITTDPKDPIRHMPPAAIVPYFTESRRLRGRFLSSIQCERLLICNLDALSSPFPFSPGVSDYVCVLPSLKSISASLCPENLAMFTTFLCGANSQIAELQKYREESGRNINIVPTGISRLDRTLSNLPETSRPIERIPTVFFLFTNPALEFRDKVCDVVIRGLLNANYRVIFKPPPVWQDRLGKFLRPLHDRFSLRDLFFPDGEQPSKYSLYHTDIVVTDDLNLGSELAILMKYPVILLNVEPQFPHCSFESAIEEIVGQRIQITDLEKISERVESLLKNRTEISHKLSQLRQAELIGPKRAALTIAMFLSGKLNVPGAARTNTDKTATA